MTNLKGILRDRGGNGVPLAVAITLALVIIFTGISEYLRLLLIAQGMRDAVQSAVITTVNDNYVDVYHGVREVYSGGYQSLAGNFVERLNYSDVYGRLDSLLGLSRSGGYHAKINPDGSIEYRVWGLEMEISNAPFATSDTAASRFHRHHPSS